MSSKQNTICRRTSKTFRKLEVTGSRGTKRVRVKETGVAVSGWIMNDFKWQTNFLRNGEPLLM